MLVFVLHAKADFVIRDFFTSSFTHHAILLTSAAMTLYNETFILAGSGK